MDKTKRLKRDRLDYLRLSIGLIDTIVHQDEDTLVEDDEVLTKELQDLKIAIQKFESNTGWKLSVQ